MTTTTVQTKDEQHVQSKSKYSTINCILVKSKIGQKELNEFLEMQEKLGSLVKKVKNMVESADIKVDDLKELLIQSYPFEEEIKKQKIYFASLLQFVSFVHQLTY